LASHRSSKLVYGSVVQQSAISGRIAPLLKRFRPTPLRVVGLALLAAFFGFAYWMNAPQPRLDYASAPRIESSGLGLTRIEWNERYGPSNDSNITAGRYAVGPVLSSPTTMFLQPEAIVHFQPEVIETIQYVQSISRSLSALGVPRMTEDDARAWGMSLLPSDAIFYRRTSEPVPHFRIVTTDILTSESLTRVYWTACAPEQYQALYQTVERGSIRLTIERDVRQELPYLVSVSWMCYSKRF
jgi:hypothetical protein